MDWQQIKTKWPDVRSKFHGKWSKLTDADLSAIGGSRTELVQRLQKHYSYDKKKAEKEAEDFVKALH